MDFLLEQDYAIQFCKNQYVFSGKGTIILSVAITVSLPE
jgi:hypothetical protein